MIAPNMQVPTRRAILSSWERCETAHKLNRDVSNPILRLQAAEVGPRLEALTEKIGGRHGIFRRLAEIASRAGHCLIVTDSDGVLVRLDVDGTETEWNGIAVGSVWDERLAGTNGVSLALLEGRDVTVRGSEHFYAKLQQYSCSGVPLRNAQNDIFGVASLSSLDRGTPGDGLFAQQLLNAAASRVQQTLFLRDFKEATIVSIAVPGRRELIKGAELVAVDARGAILGATSAAHSLSGVASHTELTGRQFDDVFGADVSRLDRVPGRVVSARRDAGPLLDLWARTPLEKATAFPGFRAKAKPPIRRNLPSSFKEFAAGSQALAALCERARTSLDHGVPLLIEGETGTGKSTLIKVLLGACPNVVTLDCAGVTGTEADHAYIQSLLQQGRIAGDLDHGTALVLDNVDEMPAFAQAAFRRLLEDIEAGAENPIKVLSTSRIPLQEAVRAGAFRDDLSYLLAGMTVVLPALRERDTPDALAQAVANALADGPVEIDSDARAAIQEYSWPGNVRELRNLLRQALLQGDGRKISGLDLTFAQPPVRRQTAARLYARDEAETIANALRSAGWNVSKAARALGMARATIHRKMKALGISRPT